jgi:hypothetical protein
VVRNAQVTLGVLDHQLGERQLVDHILLRQLVLHNELPQVTFDLRRRRHLGESPSRRSTFANMGLMDD